MKIGLLIMTVLVLSCSAFAKADDTAANATVGKMTTEARESLPKGLVPFLGLGAGYTAYDSTAPVEGAPSNFKILGSYYLPSATGISKGVFDLGAGIANQQFFQSTDISRVGTAALVEAAARYQWENRWQAGAVFNSFLNQGNTYHASQGDAQFLGVQVLKELNVGPQWLARLGGRALAETNHVGQNVEMFLVDLQLGWNPAARQPSVQAVAAQVEEKFPAKIEATAEPVKNQETILSSLLYAKRITKQNGNASATANNLTTFELGKHDIAKGDQEYLRRLARVLKASSGLYGQVIIHGYADKSGNDEINQKLSLERAQAAEAVLEKNSGLDQSRFVADGKGAQGSMHLAPSDRRIEIEFDEVKDGEALKNALSAIE